MSREPQSRCMKWYPDWYTKNRIRLALRRRNARTRRRKFLDPEKLELCRKNPELAKLDLYSVVCLACGQVCGLLSTHLPKKDSMNVFDYRAKYGANAPIQSEACRRALRNGGKRSMADPSIWLKMRSKQRREQFDWSLVVRLANGVSQRELADRFCRTQSVIGQHAHQLGFDGMQRVFDFGQPVDLRWVRSFKESTGLFVGELALRAGISEASLRSILFEDSPDRRIRSHSANNLIRCRDSLLVELLKFDFRRHPEWYPCERSSVLHAIIPHLRRNFPVFVKGLDEIRSFVRANSSVDGEQLKGFLLDQAAIEVKEESYRRLFVPLLCWASVLDRFLFADLQRLRGTEGLRRIACEWLASVWSTKWFVVHHAMRPGIAQLPQGKLEGIIRQFNSSTQAVIGAGDSQNQLLGTIPARVAEMPRRQIVPQLTTSSRSGGRPRLLAEEKQNYVIGQRVESALLRFEAAFSLIRGKSRRVGRDPNKLRMHLDSRGYSQSEIRAICRSDRPLMAARWFVSIETHLSYDSISQYHLAYRRVARKPE